MDSLLMKGGSGADLDLVTAGAGDVLAGKVIVDKNGNPLTGTMPNKGSWTGRIGVNGKIVIPKGYHNGAGYVDQAITNRGAVTYTLPINGSYTIPEGYHNGNGTVKQSIATFGAQTVKPGTSAKSVATSGKYGTGNITVAACSLPAAANLKKGVVYTLPDGSTVTGTYEGKWVYRDGIAGGWGLSVYPDDIDKITFLSSFITFKGGRVRTDQPVNLSNYKKCVIVCKPNKSVNYTGTISFKWYISDAQTQQVGVAIPANVTDKITLELPFNVALSARTIIEVVKPYSTAYVIVYEIRLE